MLYIAGSSVIRRANLAKMVICGEERFDFYSGCWRSGSENCLGTRIN